MIHKRMKTNGLKIIANDSVEEDLDEVYAFQNRHKFNGMQKNIAKQNLGLKRESVEYREILKHLNPISHLFGHCY